MLESGPAAGALAAAFFGARDGVADLLAFDMGGTTAKLSLVDDGEPLVAYGFEAARQKRFVEGSGLPIRLSTVELIEIGAGGGSIARRDEIGLLKVGPDSAGSEPGPACYGRGGTAPTVTDANLLLGYLNPDFFAGGTLTIDREAAARAIAGSPATLGLSPEAAAAGIHEVVNENMAGAARVHIAERGRDPRRYALVCTGGGGPVHGYGVARKLGITRLVCPPSPGVASAWGLLVAPARVDRVATVGLSPRQRRRSPGSRPHSANSRTRRARSSPPPACRSRAARIERLGDGRCVGQGFDLVVPLPPGPYDRRRRRAARAGRRLRARLPREIRPRPARRAARVHQCARVGAHRRARRPDRRARRRRRRRSRRRDQGPAPRLVSPKPAALSTRRSTTATASPPAATFPGPALVEDPGSTLVIGPGGHARGDAVGKHRRRTRLANGQPASKRNQAACSTPSRSKSCGAASPRSSTRRRR